MKLKWTEEDGASHFRGKAGIMFKIDVFHLGLSLEYYDYGVVTDWSQFDYIDDAKDAAQQMYDELTRVTITRNN